MRLTTTTPCCGRPVRLQTVDAAPTERYDRRCARGLQWSVTRRTLTPTDAVVRLDQLDWTT